MDRPDSAVAGILTCLHGMRHPDGQIPGDMRLWFASGRKILWLAVDKMIGSNPEPVIHALGRWYRADGAAERRRAFRWLIRQE